MFWHIVKTSQFHWLNLKGESLSIMQEIKMQKKCFDIYPSWPCHSLPLSMLQVKFRAGLTQDDTPSQPALKIKVFYNHIVKQAFLQNCSQTQVIQSIIKVKSDAYGINLLDYYLLIRICWKKPLGRTGSQFTLLLRYM